MGLNIKPNGNVGVGIAPPSAILQVNAGQSPQPILNLRAQTEPATISIETSKTNIAFELDDLAEIPAKADLALSMCFELMAEVKRLRRIIESE